jgi:hypothetical protein
MQMLSSTNLVVSRDLKSADTSTQALLQQTNDSVAPKTDMGLLLPDNSPKALIPFNIPTSNKDDSADRLIKYIELPRNINIQSVNYLDNGDVLLYETMAVEERFFVYQQKDQTWHQYKYDGKNENLHFLEIEKTCPVQDAKNGHGLVEVIDDILYNYSVSNNEGLYVTLNSEAFKGGPLKQQARHNANMRVDWHSLNKDDYVSLHENEWGRQRLAAFSKDKFSVIMEAKKQAVKEIKSHCTLLEYGRIPRTDECIVLEPNLVAISGISSPWSPTEDVGIFKFHPPKEVKLFGFPVDFLAPKATFTQIFDLRLSYRFSKMLQISDDSILFCSQHGHDKVSKHDPRSDQPVLFDIFNWKTGKQYPETFSMNEDKTPHQSVRSAKMRSDGVLLVSCALEKEKLNSSGLVFSSFYGADSTNSVYKYSIFAININDKKYYSVAAGCNLDNITLSPVNNDIAYIDSQNKTPRLVIATVHDPAKLESLPDKKQSLGLTYGKYASQVYNLTLFNPSKVHPRDRYPQVANRNYVSVNALPKPEGCCL